MDEQDRLRLEYDQASQLLRGLGETQFRLLALVPTVAGAVVALVSPSTSKAGLLAIGVLGLAATSGVLAYELGNGRVAAATAARVAGLERTLFPDGPLARETGAGRSAGIALVYGAALGGWWYLVAWGALRLGGVGHAQAAGLLAGALLGAASAAFVLRAESRPYR